MRSLLLSVVLALGAAPAAAAVFAVNSFLDQPDAKPGMNGCATASSTCTLRAAIQEANAQGGDNSITLPAGTYLLTISGTGEDFAATGDLDVHVPANKPGVLTITGASAATTIIDAQHLDRVFDVFTDATLSHLTIRNGTADQFGGGIWNSAVLTLSDVVILNNATPFSGGGIHNDLTMTLTDVTLSGNTAGSVGGGIYNAVDVVTLTNVTFTGNQASDGGGLNNDFTAFLTNVTISGNTATGAGGGIENGGTATLTNVTVAGNGAALGGALDDPGFLTIGNTILANSTAGGNCSGIDPATLTSAGHNLDSDGTCGFMGTGDLANVDPQLLPLQNNGGLTATQAIPPTSPAVDAAGSCPPPNTDQRGVARPQPMGGTCDIGAFERTQTDPTTTTTTTTSTTTTTKTTTTTTSTTTTTTSTTHTTTTTTTSTTTTTTSTTHTTTTTTSSTTTTTKTTTTTTTSTTITTTSTTTSTTKTTTTTIAPTTTTSTTTSTTTTQPSSTSTSTTTSTTSTTKTTTTTIATTTTTSTTTSTTSTTKTTTTISSSTTTASTTSITSTTASTTTSTTKTTTTTLASTTTTSTTKTTTTSTSASTTSSTTPTSTSSTATSTTKTTTTSTTTSSTTTTAPSTTSSSASSTSTTASPTTTTERLSTTTALSTSTTTTLVPPAIEQPLDGRTLLLKPRRLLVMSRDATLAIGHGEDDATLTGATLRLVSAAGNGFDVTYVLPANHWSRIGTETAPKGYRYADSGPQAGAIRRVVVKAGKLVRIVGLGSQLGYTLGSAPDPTAVLLEIGTRRYCLDFGGTTSFRTGKKFVAHDAPAPVACPARAEAIVGSDGEAKLHDVPEDIVTGAGFLGLWGHNWGPKPPASTPPAVDVAMLVH